MSQNCPNCGQPVLAGHRFCSNCGQVMPQAQAAEEQVVSPVNYVVQSYDSTTTPAPDALKPVSLGAESALRPPDSVLSQPGTAETSRSTTAGIGPAPVFAPPPPTSAPIGSAVSESGSSSYGNFTPPPSARGTGGTYAPYVTGAVQPLENPTPQRSWLMPLLLAGAAVLVLLAVGAGYLALNPKTSPSSPAGGVSPSTTIQSSLPANASDEDKVREVVRLSNDEQVLAWKTLDTEVLKGTRTGQVLDENIQFVQTLKQQNMYAVPVPQRVDIVGVKVSGDTATVRTIETWSVTFFNKSNDQPVKSSGPDTLNETYTMVKLNNKWMVKALSIDNDPNAPKPTNPPS